MRWSGNTADGSARRSAESEGSMGIALSYSPGSGGFPGKVRDSKIRRSSEGMKVRNQDPTQCELLDKNMHRRGSTRTTTTTDEGMNHLNAVISRSSFKSHSKTFHKNFPEISEMDDLIQVFTCALRKEVLYHGKMYISERHVCFHSSVLLKETKVEIHVSTIQVIKKKNTARVVPNAISIITKSDDKYVFVSLRNRHTCFQLLQSICPQLKVVSANGSPQVCSAGHGNGRELDTISSYSSQEDLMDSHNVSVPGQDQRTDITSPPESNIPNAQNTSTQWNSTNRDFYFSQTSTDVSWVTMVVEKVKSLLSMRSTTNVNKLLVIYLLIALILLLSSGYIGLRIRALEEQLNSLEAMPELGLQKEYKEL